MSELVHEFARGHEARASRFRVCVIQNVLKFVFHGPPDPELRLENCWPKPGQKLDSHYVRQAARREG